MCAAAGSGVVVAQAYGMDILGQIHYDWPLESALQVGNALLAAAVETVSVGIDTGLWLNAVLAEFQTVFVPERSP